MAEGFEPYHVPQQSRREKLRFGAVAEPATASLLGSLPHYDPSLLQSDLLGCSAAAAASRGFHDHHLQPLATAEDGGGCKSHSVNSLFKEEEGYRGWIRPSSSSSFSTNHHHQQLYDLDPPPQAAVNPSCSASIHDMRSSRPFPNAPSTLQYLRDFTHSYNNTLSLSLSSHDDNADNNCPDDNLSNPVELNLQRYGAKAAGGGYQMPAAISVGGGMASNEVSTSLVPLGPFTGYSSILKRSRFLRPAQQLLEGLCNGGRAKPVEKIADANSSLVVDASVMESYLSVEDSSSSLGSSGGDGCEVQRKKSRLISMLEEVCRQYRQSYQQMHDAVALFKYVAGFGNVAPYASLALETMSKHFRCLKSAITDQLQLNMDKGNPRRDDGYSRLGSKGYFDHQQLVWRPQRGLPERAVTVLRAWLFKHFLHPYPTDTDKIMLAKQTGLSRNQVSNWFINARVRLWKPMVEEVYMLETQQVQKASNSQREDRNVNINSSKPVYCLLPSASEAPSTSAQRVHETLSGKETWSNLPEFPMRSDDGRPKNLSYDLSGHPHHVSTREGIGGLNSSVSLTLGLHQNNRRMSLPEPFEVSAVQRFGLGLEGSGEGFVLSGYEGQGQHFRRDVFGGQLLHDFVG